MAKKVQVEVDINTNINETADDFVKLQTRIRQTKLALQEAAEAGDTVRFNALKEQLDDLQDMFDKTNVQSKKFADSLATVPGPAGAAGKAIKGLDDAFKFLVANPIVATITAIGVVLFAMYKALTQTEAGTKALSRVTEAFGRVLTPIINFISSVATPVVNAFADAINWAATKIGLVDEKLVAAQESFKEYEKSQRALIKTLEGEIEVEEARGKTIIETAAKRKQAVDAELAILDARKNAFGKLTVEEQEKYVELQQKKLVIDAQVEAKQKENAEKALKERQDAYKKDFESFESSTQVRKKLIEANYNNEKYLLDKQKAEGLLKENDYNLQVFELTKEKNNDLLAEEDKFQASRLAFLKNGLDKGLITRKEYDQYVLDATKQFNDQKTELDKQGKDTEISFLNEVANKLKELKETQVDVNKQIAESWIELGSNLAGTFTQLANLFEKGSDAQKNICYYWSVDKFCCSCW